MVEGIIDHLGKPAPHFGLLTISDSINKQLAQRSALKMDLAKHIKHLATQRIACFLKFLQQTLI